MSIWAKGENIKKLMSDALMLMSDTSMLMGAARKLNK